jgi:AcrR family transcriptional regulator
MRQKQTYHHGDLQQALIEAAIALIAEKDVSSLSLREVARRVGVSHAAPYRHFADKDALLAAVAREGFQGLSEALKLGLQQAPPDPLKRLEATGVAYVGYAIAHPSYYRVMFGAYRGEGYPSLEQASQEAFGVLVGVIVEGQGAGVVRSGEPRQLAWVAWSLVHGLAMLLIDGQLPVTEGSAIESLASVAARMLIEGLAGGSRS